MEHLLLEIVYGARSGLALASLVRKRYDSDLISSNCGANEPFLLQQIYIVRLELERV
jgi:hypothetical protein